MKPAAGVRVSAMPLCLLALSSASGFVRAQDVAAPPPMPPEFVDAYIGYERMGDVDVWLDGNRWYHRNALRIVDGRVSLYKSPVFCHEGRLWFSESDGGFYWYEGAIEPPKQARDGRDVAVLTLASCDHCGRAMIPQSEPVKLSLPVTYTTADTLRLGDVTYDRRIAPDSTVCPAIATQDDDAADAAAISRTE